jgi:hypothetical protein
MFGLICVASHGIGLKIGLLRNAHSTIGVHAITPFLGVSSSSFQKKVSGGSHCVQYRTGAAPGNHEVHQERGEVLRVARCRFEDPTHFLLTAPGKAAAK